LARAAADAVVWRARSRVPRWNDAHHDRKGPVTRMSSRSVTVCTVLTGVIAAAVVSTVLAQEPRTTTRVIFAGSARVQRIDLSTRSLTVRTIEGIVHAVYVPRDLKVFNELKTGDTVDVRVEEEVIVALNARGRPTVLIDSTADARKAAGGETEVLQQ